MAATYLDPNVPNALVRLSQVLRQSILVEPQSMSQIQLSNIEQRESVRQAIDEGIHLLASLKSYRNYVAPISFLPNEILARIFFEYVLISDPWSGKWSKIILVCRRWHDVAMSEASLWSWIAEGARFGDERCYCWLDRSKSHPLQYKIQNSLYPSIILAAHFHRVRTLEVEADWHTAFALFANINQLPILEELSLHCWRRTHRDDEDGSPRSGVWFVPNFIVHGGASRLRSLKLDTTTFADKADFHLLSNLTHLTLACDISEVDNMTLPSLLELFELLQRSPRLQELNLRHCVDIATLLQQRTLPPSSIPLLELQRLDLNMDITVITALMQSLTIPNNTYLSMVLHPTWHDDDAFRESNYFKQLQDLLIPVRIHLRSKKFPTLRSMGIESSHYLGLSFSEKTEYPISRLASFNDIAFHILIYYRQQKEARKLLSKIMHAVPLDELTRVDASSILHDETSSTYSDGSFRRGELSPQTWRKLFGLLMNPVEVRIGVNDAMLCMLEGAMEALRRGPHKLPLRKSARRLARSRGCPSFDRINLLASRHPGKWRHGPDEEEQEAYYESLLDQLAEYQDIDGISKPRGERLAMLSFDEVEAGYLSAFSFAPRLFELTEQLVISDIRWDPVRFGNYP